MKKLKDNIRPGYFEKMALSGGTLKKASDSVKLFYFIIFIGRSTCAKNTADPRRI
jgi:hypothetical protein